MREFWETFDPMKELFCRGGGCSFHLVFALWMEHGPSHQDRTCNSSGSPQLAHVEMSGDF